MVKTVFIDPALRGEAGHHLGLCIELSEAAHGLGHEPVWLGHKNLDARLVPDFARYVPAFSSGIYERQIGTFGRALHPFVGDRRWLRSIFAERDWEIRVRHGLRLSMLSGDRCRELGRALRDVRPGKDDHIIIPSADPQTVNMLSAWAAAQRPDQVPEIHIRTCWSHSNMPFAGYAGGFAAAIRRLRSVARIVTLAAETSFGANFWTRETGINFDACPHLLSPAILQLPPPENAPDQLVIGWLGEPRPEKGVNILADIIRAVLNAKPRRQLKFLLQAGGRTSRKARQLYTQLEEFGDAIELLDVVMPQQDYLAALRRCGLILLPYDPKAYPPERGSGAALEALLTGRPIVTNAQTFAAGLVAPDSGVIGSDAATLAAGILAVAGDYERYLTGAKRAKERARDTYNRENCYRLLIGWKLESALPAS